MIFGLSAALYGKITIKDGAAVQGNFDTYRMVRLAEAPKIDVHLVPSGGKVWGGAGEAGDPADRRRGGERDLRRDRQAHSHAADHAITICPDRHSRHIRQSRARRPTAALRQSKKPGATPAQEAEDVTIISRTVFCGAAFAVRRRRHRAPTRPSVLRAVAANIWRAPAIASPATRSPAARRSPAASRWARRSAPFTRPTSRPIPRPASAATASRISIAPCGKASPRTATGSIRRCLIRPTPSSPTRTWRRSTTSS